MTVFVCLLILITLGQVYSDCPNNKVVACYYSSWGIYREDDGKFTINDINATLCTHLIYSFAGLDLNSKIMSLDVSNDITFAGYTTFTALKEKNPCLKTLLAIGGWNEGSMKYSVMVSTKESREAFAESVLRFLAYYNFDGLDFDWEYPTQRGGINEDKTNFLELLKYLRERFDKWGLLLTIAVPLSASVTESAYDMQQVSKFVDHVFVMAYDFTPVNSKQTGLLAPMHEIQKTIEKWITVTGNNKKLVLGLPSYARSFTLNNTKSHDLEAPTNGTGRAGEFTKEPGFLSYYELGAKLATKRYTVVPSQGSYYAYYYTDWLSFDLKDSYQTKINYALSKNLGGVMVWSIDTEDFKGMYNDTSFPILQTIYEIFHKN